MKLTGMIASALAAFWFAGYASAKLLTPTSLWEGPLPGRQDVTTVDEDGFTWPKTAETLDGQNVPHTMTEKIHNYIETEDTRRDAETNLPLFMSMTYSLSYLTDDVCFSSPWFVLTDENGKIATTRDENFAHTVVASLADDIRGCTAKNIAIPLTMFNRELNSGHANMLLVNRETKTVTRIEPHGVGLPDDPQYILGLGKIEDVFTEELGFAITHNKIPIQLFELVDELVGNGQYPAGFCEVWSWYYLEMRLTNPRFTNAEIDRKIFDRFAERGMVELYEYVNFKVNYIKRHPPRAQPRGNRVADFFRGLMSINPNAVDESRRWDRGIRDLVRNDNAWNDVSYPTNTSDLMDHWDQATELMRGFAWPRSSSLAEARQNLMIDETRTATWMSTLIAMVKSLEEGKPMSDATWNRGLDILRRHMNEDEATQIKSLVGRRGDRSLENALERRRIIESGRRSGDTSLERALERRRIIESGRRRIGGSRSRSRRRSGRSRRRRRRRPSNKSSSRWRR